MSTKAAATQGSTIQHHNRFGFPIDLGIGGLKRGGDDEDRLARPHHASRM